MWKYRSKKVFLNKTSVYSLLHYHFLKTAIHIPINTSQFPPSKVSKDFFIPWILSPVPVKWSIVNNKIMIFSCAAYEKRRKFDWYKYHIFEFMITSRNETNKLHMDPRVVSWNSPWIILDKNISLEWTKGNIPCKNCKKPKIHL